LNSHKQSKQKHQKSMRILFWLGTNTHLS